MVRRGTSLGVPFAVCLALAAGSAPPAVGEDRLATGPTTVEVTAEVVTVRLAQAALRDDLLSGHVDAWLRPARYGSRSERAGPGMSATVTPGPGNTLRLRPRFPLISGTNYEIVLTRGGDRLATLPVAAIADADVPPAEVAAIWPAAPVLPSNTLRLYLVFDAPMARGRGRDSVRLETAAGERLDDSFLNLATELWSDGQTRRTLLLDPGRIKQGVGPNLEGGAPLATARTYRIVVDAGTLDARGRPIGRAHVHTFRVGPAERRAIDPLDWTALRPAPDTMASLTIRFDRLMDRAIARRALILTNAEGVPFGGHVETGDRTWTFHPASPWPTGPIRVAVDPVLEDVAGNTLCHPFDAVAGSAERCEAPIVLDLAELDGPAVTDRTAERAVEAAAMPEGVAR